MNGIEKLTQQISADAQVEIDAILAEGQKKADAVTAEYAKRADAYTADARAKAVEAARQREERMVSMAELAARKDLLAVKQKMVDKAFERALELLCALPEEEYIALLTKLALKVVTGGEQLIFSESDHARVGERVVACVNSALPEGQVTLSPQTRPIRGGFILTDGDVEVNCAFETLVRLMRGEVAGEVAGTLFS